MAMKKKAPKKSDPKPPKSSMTDKAKVAGAAAKSKMSKETSARTREKVAARKKSGENYLIKPTYGMTDSYFRKTYSNNDLAGIGRIQFDDYGVVSSTGGRTSQRYKDQAKRANARSAKSTAKRVKRKER